MIEKTRGIVLHTTKHTDSALIVHFFTEKLGRISVMARGVHSRKSNTRNVYFQPMTILNIELYYRETRDIQNLKEVSVDVNYSRIPYDISRSTMAIFMGEVLYRTLHEKEQDLTLFNYIAESMVMLDMSDQPIANFHISFLVGYSKFLGIAPSNLFPASRDYFDMESGTFSGTPPAHGKYFDPEQSEILYLFLNSTPAECSNIKLSGNLRRRFLENILEFFSLHLSGMKKIRSLDVLTELFT